MTALLEYLDLSILKSFGGGGGGSRAPPASAPGLLGEIAVLLGVYKLRILAVGDYLTSYLTDVSTILVFVCKNRVVLAEFQHIDG